MANNDGQSLGKSPRIVLTNLIRRVSPICQVVDFKAAFDLSVELLYRKAFPKCNMGCPFGHYTQLVESTPVTLEGHPIVCYTNTDGFQCILYYSVGFSLLIFLF